MKTLPAKRITAESHVTRGLAHIAANRKIGDGADAITRNAACSSGDARLAAFSFPRTGLSALPGFA